MVTSKLADDPRINRLPILKLLSAVTFKDEPGTLSVPLTNIDIAPKEPTA
jgi:hypothetical protein